MARWEARLSPGLGAPLRISHARYDDLKRPCPFAARSISATSSLGTVTEKLLVVRGMPLGVNHCQPFLLRLVIAETGIKCSSSSPGPNIRIELDLRDG